MKKVVKTFATTSALFLFICTFVSSLNENSIAHAVRKRNIAYNLESKDTSYAFNESNYNYGAPQKAKFINEPVEGKAFLKNDRIVIGFNGNELVVPNFDFYRILDDQNSIILYQADVAKDPSLNKEYAYVGVLLNQKGLHELRVHYGIVEKNTLYLINAILSDEIFNYIEKKAQDFRMGSDELSSRLRASSNAHFLGISKDSINNQDVDENKIAARALKIIKENEYDSYTNSDVYIDEYSKKTRLSFTYTSSGYTTDDDIVKIIPKELFFIKGNHFYIGKEYGFFVKVTEQMAFGTSYLADVLVFDIENQVPSFPSSPTGTCRIIPKFNWRYQIREKTYSDWLDYDPSLTQLVTIPNDYNYAELFLDDIGIKVSLENPDIPNYGEKGYISSQDDGAFIIQTRVNSKGVGLKKKNKSFLADTIYFAFGFVPYVSTILNVYQYVENLHYGFGESGYVAYREESLMDNEVNIDTYATNNTDQISRYGKLIKSKAVTIKSSSDSPRLIHVGGYAEIKYVIARRSNSTYNRVRVISSISACALEDHTAHWWDFGWLFPGEVVNYGRATGTYVTAKQ